MNKDKFRASYSVLKYWSTGLPAHQEQAIMAYFKMPTEVNEFMKQGKEYHKEWENSIIADGCYPALFGGKKLERYQSEHKIVADLDEWLELVGVIDLLHYEEPIGWVVEDFKTGRTPSSNYLGTQQLGIYALLCKLRKIDVKQVRIRHYNQYTGETDTSFSWVNDEMINEALEWVITWSSDMHNFLTSNKVYDDPYKFLGITPAN